MTRRLSFEGMKILLLENNEQAAHEIIQTLKRSCFAVRWIQSPESLDSVQEEYDLMVMDVRTAGSETLEKVPVPVIAIGDANPLERAALLEEGAADFIADPILNTPEFLIRIKTALKRAQPATPQQIKVGDLVFNPVARTVNVHGRDIRLTRKEASLFEYLLMNSRQILSRQQIILHIWDSEISSNVVDAHLKNLRKKIDSENSNIIETVWGLGYRINPENSGNLQINDVELNEHEKEKEKVAKNKINGDEKP